MSMVCPTSPSPRVKDIGAGESTRGMSVGRFGERSRSPQISQEFSEGWFRNVHLEHAKVASLLCNSGVALEDTVGSPPGGYNEDSEDSGVGDRGGCWKVESSNVAGGCIPHAKQGGIEAAAVTCGV